MKRWPWFAGIWIALAATGSAANDVARAPERLTRFLEARVEAANRLIEPVADCVEREDTGYASFHGCRDWHSAVHGLWALVAYTRTIDRERFGGLIGGLLEPARLESERNLLRSHPDFEMPYGRAWLLRLATEYQATFADDLLAPFAEEVAASLTAYLRSMPVRPKSRSYESHSWALISLHDYAGARGDGRLLLEVEDLARPFLEARGACPFATAEASWRSFMPVCTNWAALVARILPRESFRTWVREFLPVGKLPAPISEPSTAHNQGTNFGRAWGLWTIYRKSDEPGYLDSFLRHFEATYGQPDWRTGTYRAVGHWISQFGMLALMATFHRAGDETIVDRAPGDAPPAVDPRTAADRED